MCCGCRAPTARAAAAGLGLALLLAGPASADAPAAVTAQAGAAAAQAAAPRAEAAETEEAAETASEAEPAEAPSEATPGDDTGGPGIDRICALIAESAAAHGLAPEFLARLIWKESRFDHRALSPAGAQGIAQFMPATAAERGLADPWDPAQAIPASAAYLAALRAQFGNWGLAAAAYNGGPDRVARWLARGGALPWETLDYVRSITFRPAEWFRTPGREVEPRPLDPGRDFDAACRAMPVIATRALGGGRPPWGVQVAFGRSRAAVLRAWRRVAARHEAVIEGREPMVLRNRRGRLSAPWVARLGAASRAEAGRLCARLKARGAPCTVLRN